MALDTRPVQAERDIENPDEGEKRIDP